MVGKIRKSQVAQVFLYIIVGILLFIMLYPLAMALWSSFKSPNTYLDNKWLPTLPLRIRNLKDAFGNIDNYLLNTFIVVLVGIPVMLFLSSMASYALARTKIIGRNVIFYMIIMVMMVPGVLTLVPSFILYRTLGMYNSPFALIVPIWTGGCVNAVFLLVNMYKGIPVDLFEAAEIDGAGTFTRYIKIALPLSAPILGTVVIMSIVSIWNDLAWPMLILEPERYTITAGLELTFRTIIGQEPIMYASYLLASVPLILLFIFANRFYIQGLMGTAIKL